MTKSSAITNRLSITLTDLIIDHRLASLTGDGSFTVADSKSFLSPYEVRPMVQENKYSGIC